MTDDSDDTRDVPVETVDEIERIEATRPWPLNEVTVHELDRIDELHRSIDTAFVPWGVQEPVDRVEVLFTMDPKVLLRRGRTVEDVVADVVPIVESDSRLDEYVIWEQIEPTAVVAEIDESRHRVKISWSVGGGN